MHTNYTHSYLVEIIFCAYTMSWTKILLYTNWFIICHCPDTYCFQSPTGLIRKDIMDVDIKYVTSYQQHSTYWYIYIETYTDKLHSSAFHIFIYRLETLHSFLFHFCFSTMFGIIAINACNHIWNKLFHIINTDVHGMYITLEFPYFRRWEYVRSVVCFVCVKCRCLRRLVILIMHLKSSKVIECNI